ncbi:MAG: hypothetical protein ACD_39C00439G0003 [uncultured bacterium]|nr:MAG: hypothetical protein ACD_39C00439G0003 [uncultured bacterium]
MALASGSDDHNVVSAVPCGHAHAANIVFKTTGSYFGCNNRLWLRIYVVKVFSCRQRNRVFQRLRHLFEMKFFDLVAAVDVFAPCPAFAARMIVFEIV